MREDVFYSFAEQDVILASVGTPYTFKARGVGYTVDLTYLRAILARRQGHQPTYRERIELRKELSQNIGPVAQVTAKAFEEGENFP